MENQIKDFQKLIDEKTLENQRLSQESFSLEEEIYKLQ
jgi:peptidoglycan hydrolase CwlO-like protein